MNDNQRRGMNDNQRRGTNELAMASEHWQVHADVITQHRGT
jgi:hypothetical protein